MQRWSSADSRSFDGSNAYWKDSVAFASSGGWADGDGQNRWKAEDLSTRSYAVATMLSRDGMRNMPYSGYERFCSDNRMILFNGFSSSKIIKEGRSASAQEAM